MYYGQLWLARQSLNRTLNSGNIWGVITGDRFESGKELKGKKAHQRWASITSGTHTLCLPWIATGPLIMVLTTADWWLLSSGSSGSSLCKDKMEMNRVWNSKKAPKSIDIFASRSICVSQRCCFHGYQKKETQSQSPFSSSCQNAAWQIPDHLPADRAETNIAPNKTQHATAAKTVQCSTSWCTSYLWL